MKKTFKIFLVINAVFILNYSFSNAQTYFSDNFESGLGRWVVSGNDWDTLSSTYNSSNHCITDSRVGNYTYNSDPTITMTQSLNLTNAAFPVLTFFQRYNLIGTSCSGGGDNIYAQVSPNSGSNWITLQSWQYTNLAWSFVQLDLRNYRFSNVKIRFQLSVHNACMKTADGWYIDDIKIIENDSFNPTLNLPFSDDFENGLGKWIVGRFNWDTVSMGGNRYAAVSRMGNYTLIQMLQ